MKNILNLLDWTILHDEENPHDYQFTVQYNKDTDLCMSCFTFGPVKFGVIDQLIMDLPIHAKRVGLNVQRQRYRCKNCGKTFMQAIPDVDDKRSMTGRLLRFIEKESLRRTFTSIAEDVGVTEKTIRNIFHDHIAYLEETTTFVTPEWMGIDELHLLKQPRCIVTNVKERTVVELLEKRDKTSVTNYLYTVKDRANVRVVTMDMWNPYRTAVTQLMPDAEIVVDKFHVVRMANEAMETVRKRVRTGLTDRQRRTLMHDRFILLRRRSELEPRHELVLETWKANFPLLGQAYDLKEGFMGIWDATTRAGAEYLYKEWEQRIPTELTYAFDPITTAMKNWRRQVFAYFEFDGATNAYTEALNGLVKMTNRIGRGYSFEAIRAKLLYGTGLHKVRKPPYQKQWTPDVPEMGFPVDDEPVLNFGSDLSTLTRLLEIDGLDDESTLKSE